MRALSAANRFRLVLFLLSMLLIAVDPVCLLAADPAPRGARATTRDSGTKLPPIRASEGDTARAIRGRPAVSPEQVWNSRDGKLHVGKPDKPAILLFHGLNRTRKCWDAPSIDGDIPHFDYKTKPEPHKIGEKSYPGIGVYKIGVTENELEIDPHNWFDYLAAQGFTVGSFSQDGPTFDKALASAKPCYEYFMEKTREINPSAPPPVALIGHSRGGLMIRAVTKELGGKDRVKWVITLMTPHQGSEVARATEVVEDEIRKTVRDAIGVGIDLPAGLSTQQLVNSLEDQLIRALRPLLDMVDAQLAAEDRELAPDSPLILGLAQNENPISGAKYYTFGGTNVRYARIDKWVFTAGSAHPHTKVQTQGIKTRARIYYKWEARPSEFGPLSPMLEKVRDICDEIKPGKGDGLVADARARLPFATHKTLPLNHAEVLWDRPLQREVVGLILGPGGLFAGKDLVLKPMAAQSPAAREIRDLSERQVAVTTTALEKLAPAETAPAEESATAEGSRPQEKDDADARADTSAGDRPTESPSLNAAEARAEAGGGMTLVMNPDLKGRLGRICITYPEEAEANNSRWQIRRGDDEKEIASGYGNAEKELLPGTYIVTITNKPIQNVAVQSKHDANIPVGVLHIFAGSDTRFEVFDQDNKTSLTSGYGEQQIGLPVGKYHVKIAEQSEPVEIRDGEVTEF